MDEVLGLLEIPLFAPVADPGPHAIFIDWVVVVHCYLF